MSSKRSILNRVLYLNLTMAVVLTLVFLCTSGLYARQLTRERYNLASTTLTKVNTDFQLEMNRLDSLPRQCRGCRFPPVSDPTVPSLCKTCIFIHS